MVNRPAKGSAPAEYVLFALGEAGGETARWHGGVARKARSTRLSIKARRTAVAVPEPGLSRTCGARSFSPPIRWGRFSFLHPQRPFIFPTASARGV